MSDDLDQIYSIDTFHADHRIRITFSYQGVDDEDIPEEANFVLVASVGEHSANVTFTIGLMTGALSIVGLDPADPLVKCLVACGVGASVGALIDCRTSDIKKFIKCLKKKGISIAGAALTCALQCFINP